MCLHRWQKNVMHQRWASWLLILLLLLSSLLSHPVRSQDRPWTYRVWDNGDVPVAGPVVVEVWGLAELREAQEANPRTHGTVSFYTDGPCWRVSVEAGERVWMWEETAGCWRYHFPMVGVAGR